MNKTTLNAVPVLSEPQRDDPLNGGGAQSGEARESTNTKLKRPVEQVASGTRGGVQSFYSGVGNDAARVALVTLTAEPSNVIKARRSACSGEVAHGVVHATATDATPAITSTRLFGLGRARFQALLEALELIEEKAIEKGLIIWDHEKAIQAKNAKDYRYEVKKTGRKRKPGAGRKRRPRDLVFEEALFGGKVVRIEACALVHYVIPRGDQIYNANYEELNLVR